MGEMYSGRRKVFGIAIEDNRGTYQSPDFWVNVNELSFDNKTTKVNKGGAVGSIQAGLDNVTVKKYAEGSFSADLDDKAIGVVLASLFGQLPTTTGTTNLTHAYSILNSNQHQSLAICVQDPNVSEQFGLGMINSLEVSVEPEGKVQYTAEFKSKASVDGTAEVPSYSALGNTFLHQHTVVKIATNKAGLAGAVSLNVNKITLTVSKNIEERYSLGSVDVTNIANKDMVVEGELEIEFTDDTFKDYDLADASKAMSIKFGSSNNSLEFVIPKVTFEGWEPSFGLEDIVTQKIAFKGVWNITDGLIEATLKNQTDYAGQS